MKVLNYLLAGLIIFLVMNFTNISINPKNETISQNGNKMDMNTIHQAWVILTVSESKRLIAKGLKKYAPVAERLNRGQVIVTKGTTNTYFVEELINDTLASGEYVLGHILPEEGDIELDRSNTRQELVIINGVIQDIPYSRTLDGMNEGDIVIKGANIINYQKGQAGVLIGSPTGGTTGVILPKIKEHGLRLIIPVGLEKESTQDINQLDRYSKIPHETTGRNMPEIWSIEGELFTELEAIRQFADVDPVHISSGGIGGAEGAVTICIRGKQDEVMKALEIIRTVQGEPPFIR